MSTTCSFSIRDRRPFDVVIDPSLPAHEVLARTGIDIMDRGFDCLFPMDKWGGYPAGPRFIKRLHLVRFAEPLAGKHLGKALGSHGLQPTSRLIDLLILAGQHIVQTVQIGTILALASAKRSTGAPAAALLSGESASTAALRRILSIESIELIKPHAYVLAENRGDHAA
jgi:hypothetical protein